MVSLNHVEEQLKRAGCNFRFWGRWEIHELSKILLPDETVAHIANGRYAGGFAMLAVTDQRLLLIDRKPMFMALEDIRFDMIAEIDFSAQPLNSTVRITTTSRTLVFSSWSQHHLREVLNHTQAQMMLIRQGFSRQSLMDAIKSGQQQVTEQSEVVLGNLALQTGGTQRPLSLPVNPYNKTPVLMRRRRYPRFY